MQQVAAASGGVLEWGRDIVGVETQIDAGNFLYDSIVGGRSVDYAVIFNASEDFTSWPQVPNTPEPKMALGSSGPFASYEVSATPWVSSW
jgi:hypothetical protein